MGKDQKPIIADPIVEKKVRLQLNKPIGVLTESDLGKVVGLGFYTNKISNESLSELVKLPKLETLSIAGNKGLDLSAVAKLTQLKSLNLSGNQIVDASPLAKLKLETLMISGNKGLDLRTLAKITQLKSLNLSGNQIVDASPLAKLKQLEHLGISLNKEIDLNTLAKLTQIERLTLMHNQITDISPVAKLKQLKHLGIYHNKEIDLSTLTRLTQIESLTLQGNQIADISPLAKLTQLVLLDLSYSQIADTRPLAKLIQLKKLVWIMGFTHRMGDGTYLTSSINGTHHTPEKVAQINKSVTPGCVVVTFQLDQFNVIEGMVTKNESKKTITKRAKKLTPEEKQVVGSWLMKEAKNGLILNFLEDGTYGASDNERSWGLRKWSIENKEVHRNLGGEDGVEILKINPDGSLTVVGMISRGIRVGAPKQFQHNFIKSK